MPWDDRDRENTMGQRRPAVKCSSHQKLEDAREGPPPEASEGGWPCQHLDFRFLTSRTMRVPVSV